MTRTWLILLTALGLGLGACPSTNDDDDLGGGGGDDDDDPTFVQASVGGATYQGNSQGVVYNEAADPTELMLWPADALSGYAWGWEPGETGVFTLSSGEVALAVLYFIDPDSSVQFVSDSGTFTIDEWEEHTPDNAADTRLGYIAGTFEGTFVEYAGSATIEVTGGTYYSMVSSL